MPRLGSVAGRGGTVVGGVGLEGVAGGELAGPEAGCEFVFAGFADVWGEEGAEGDCGVVSAGAAGLGDALDGVFAGLAPW